MDLSSFLCVPLRWFLQHLRARGEKEGGINQKPRAGEEADKKQFLFSGEKWLGSFSKAKKKKSFNFFGLAFLSVFTFTTRFYFMWTCSCSYLKIQMHILEPFTMNVLKPHRWFLWPCLPAPFSLSPLHHVKLRHKKSWVQKVFFFFFRQELHPFVFKVFFSWQKKT